MQCYLTNRAGPYRTKQAIVILLDSWCRLTYVANCLVWPTNPRLAACNARLIGLIIDPSKLWHDTSHLIVQAAVFTKCFCIRTYSYPNYKYNKLREKETHRHQYSPFLASNFAAKYSAAKGTICSGCSFRTCRHKPSRTASKPGGILNSGANRAKAKALHLKIRYKISPHKL